MAINLNKGQTIDLRKPDGGGLTRVRMGLGWDAKTVTKKTLFGGTKTVTKSIDLDASALLCAGSEVVETVYFGHLRSDDGSLQHTGDNLTGAGDGDDESIVVDLRPRERPDVPEPECQEDGDVGAAGGDPVPRRVRRSGQHDAGHERRREHPVQHGHRGLGGRRDVEPASDGDRLPELSWGPSVQRDPVVDAPDRVEDGGEDDPGEVAQSGDVDRGVPVGLPPRAESFADGTCGGLRRRSERGVGTQLECPGQVSGPSGRSTSARSPVNDGDAQSPMTVVVGSPTGRLSFICRVTTTTWKCCTF